MSNINHLFADDLLGVISSQIGLNTLRNASNLNITLCCRIKRFILKNQLQCFRFEQSVCQSWTSILMIFIRQLLNESPISFYLGYTVSSTLGWGKLLKLSANKIVCTIWTYHSVALFSSFVIRLFTWLYSIFSPTTKKQNTMTFTIFYSTRLRWVLLYLHWNKNMFSFALDEKLLDDIDALYTEQRFISVCDPVDGIPLF